MSRLRAPAVSHTTSSLLWGLGFALYIFVGGLAIGWASVVSLTLAVAFGFCSFLLNRTFGGDAPARG